MIAVSDGGIAIGKNSVQYNDMRALQQEFVKAGYSAEILFKNEYSKALKAKKAIFAHIGTIVNFGGIQQDTLKEALNVINQFDGPVIAFTNDVIDGIKNQDRAGFVKIERPVYYADPGGFDNSKKLTKDLQICGGLSLNQSWVIGKNLAKLKDVKTAPKYQYIYGGRNRPKIVKYLKKLTSVDDTGLLYGEINQDVKSKFSFSQKFCFTNRDVRTIDSLGKYSFMFSEKNKNYYTSRVFEQLLSNSIVLFDTEFKELKEFWTDNNTFSNQDELIDRINEPWSWERVKAQHEMVRNFNFDKRINKEAQELVKIIG